MQSETPPPGDRARRRSRERRQHLYDLAAVYDRCVIRAWVTRGVPGMEDEHSDAVQRLETARRRLDRAGRGLP